MLLENKLLNELSDEGKSSSGDKSENKDNIKNIKIADSKKEWIQELSFDNKYEEKTSFEKQIQENENMQWDFETETENCGFSNKSSWVGNILKFSESCDIDKSIFIILYKMKYVYYFSIYFLLKSNH